MSEYGPALFIFRKDGQPIAEADQQELVKLVQGAAKALKITFDDDEPASPEMYDYDGYESGALSVLLYSSFVYGIMPDEVREDEEKGAVDEALKIGRHIDKKLPDTYRYKAYFVEN